MTSGGIGTLTVLVLGWTTGILGAPASGDFHELEWIVPPHVEDGGAAGVSAVSIVRVDGSVLRVDWSGSGRRLLALPLALALATGGDGRART